MDDIVLEEVAPNMNANITVVGVGGGGNNMISHLKRTGVNSSVKLIIANTDVQHMAKCKVENKIVLGQKLTKGLGAGANPEVGKEAAEESYEGIKEALQGSDLVIISAGMGGGTGTGAAPVFARAAKEVGALTVAIVTKPFNVEGRKKSKLAEEGLKRLCDSTDSIVLVPNEKLMSVIGKNVGYKEGLKLVDDVLSRAVNGIVNIILKNSEDGMNVDFADVTTVMKYKGLALMGIGEAKGEDAATQAVRDAIESPLFDSMSIKGSKGAIVNFEFNPNYPLVSISEAMAIVEEAASEDADIIMGTMTTEDLDIDEVRVSIIATGFDEEKKAPDTTLQTVSTESGSDMDSVLHKMVRKVSSGENFDDVDLSLPSYQRYKKD
ncbi:cell division protein FtsZ [Helicobacter sp. 11S02629-2]|uniref:cell division protein FtsZ n=1 Tax=Helicobacter sp. 11S02629-2 TaxID=1476195 RepID=UPI000BA73417|nr:cell division protein FtsZ [Helicobacter sp. 11S02629-2]PAF45421.1 cell division protein FtsZ [Helicobacter sp. 11S02629-2]